MIAPTVILFFLAPAIGELLSGSSPPLEFFQPFSLIVQVALYGSGAILVRETALHWNKRWPSIFVLGLAYGIVEEGLMVKSFFDPKWMDLGILGSYGRWAGVNWVWSVGLSVYHMIFSIAIPILLVELMFPALRQERWIGKRGMIFFACLLILDVVFGYLALTAYRPPAIPYLAALGVVILLFWLARRMPKSWMKPQSNNVVHPWRFGLTGFIATVLFFFALWAMPHLKLPVIITLFSLLLLPLATLWMVQRLSKQGNFTAIQQHSIVSGALLFFILLAPVQQFDTARTDNTSGMIMVGSGFLCLLVFLWWKITKLNISSGCDTLVDFDS